MFKRTLAAIVLADVVGYSRMMGEDETGTLDRLGRFRSEVINPAISVHHGRIVNAVGDSLLLEFPSVVDATQCAIAMQQGLAERNAVLPEPERLAFRMGVNIGDVIVKDRNLFGDSVNIAARIGTLAEPGGVCLSAAAYEQTRGKIEADFVDKGAHQVKNISRPVEVFALSPQAIGQMPRRSPCGAQDAAVDPFGPRCRDGRCPRGRRFDIQQPSCRKRSGHSANSILAGTQAGLSDKSRAKLIADYMATGRHRAFVIAPKARTHWWTGDWPTPEAASEKALERCQLAFDVPCHAIAIDEGMTTASGADAPGPRDMPRLHYAGDFDPAQIPGIRVTVATRADVAGYRQALGPKAAAIHPRGILAIVTSATSQHRAASQALKRCNDDELRRVADGPCFLYALGDTVVLPQRQTSAVTKP